MHDIRLIDVAHVIDLTRYDRVLIASGDWRFAALAREVHDIGVGVWSAGYSWNTSRRLRDAVDRVSPSTTTTWPPDPGSDTYRPSMHPTVVAIHIAPASRLPMKSVDVVEAEAGAGLVGDRYHGTRHRHVTVQSATSLEEAAALLGSPIDPGHTRRNITIASGDIPTAPGSRLRIGNVDLEVVRVAAPCKLLDDVIGSGARKALHARAGSVCRVLTSGAIQVGDVVSFESVD